MPSSHITLVRKPIIVDNVSLHRLVTSLSMMYDDILYDIVRITPKPLPPHHVSPVSTIVYRSLVCWCAGFIGLMA